MTSETFFSLRVKPKSAGGPTPVEVLHKNECKACPLDKVPGLRHPKMEPTGSDAPLVYMLGEAPDADEDAAGEQFVGKAGRTLRSRIPEDWSERLRWNNVVRTRPPANKTPGFTEIECCRPSIVRDIEATKPRAIFGFDNVPLNWALGVNGITMWRGRRVPVRVGGHSCWYFPMFHPSYVNRKEQNRERDADETLFVFELDLENAFAAVEGLPEPEVHTKEDALEGVEYVTGEKRGDMQTVLRFIDRCFDAKVVGVDFETNAVRPYVEDARILTVALSADFGTLAFPLQHSKSGWDEGEHNKIEDALVDLLYEAKGHKAVHHVGFELEWSGFFWGKEIVRAGAWDCTMSQAYVLDERRHCFGLDFLTLLHFGLNVKTLASLNKERLDEEPLADVLVYNGVDAKYHRLLFMKQAKLIKEAGLDAIYREHMKRPATMVLSQMQGLPVDQEVVKEFAKKYNKLIEEAETKIGAAEEVQEFEKKFERRFRPSANHDVRDLVQQVIGAPIEKVDEATLKPIKNKLVRLILRHRHLLKTLSTYIKPVSEGSKFLFPDGKLHPIIKTTDTVTWRTSSDSPSIQNWPKRQGEQHEVRRQIKPKPGKRGARKIVSFDYGQIQVRGVAQESKDKTLIKMLWDEYDMHADWMERIAKAYPRWGGDLKDENVRKAKRHSAKNSLVFPLFFGASEHTIARHLNIPVECAAPLREQFWDMFPGVKAWHDAVRKFFKRHGYVAGLAGFRRRAPVSYTEMINCQIQADEAAIVCDAMYRLSVKGYQACLEIHDDLTYILYEDEVEKKSEVIIHELLNCPFEWAHVVPLVVERSIGDDWYALKDAGVFTIRKGVITG